MAKEHWGYHGDCGQEEPGAHGAAGVDRQGFIQLCAPASQVAQDKSQSGDEATGEAATWCIMAREEEIEGNRDHRREEHAGRDIDHKRAVKRLL